LGFASYEESPASPPGSISSKENEIFKFKRVQAGSFTLATLLTAWLSSQLNKYQNLYVMFSLPTP